MSAEDLKRELAGMGPPVTAEDRTKMPPNMDRMRWYKDGKLVGEWRRESGTEPPSIPPGTASYLVFNSVQMGGGQPIFFPLAEWVPPEGPYPEPGSLAALRIRLAMPEDMPDET